MKKPFVPFPERGLYREEPDPAKVAAYLAEKKNDERVTRDYPLDRIIRRCGYTVRDGGGSRRVAAWREEAE